MAIIVLWGEEGELLKMYKLELGGSILSYNLIEIALRFMLCLTEKGYA